MSILSKISKKIAAAIPGSGISVAREKRLLEKQLRADGWSRKAAATEVARKFGHEKNPV